MFENDDTDWDLDGDSFLSTLPQLDQYANVRKNQVTHSNKVSKETAPDVGNPSSEDEFVSELIEQSRRLPKNTYEDSEPVPKVPRLEHSIPENLIENRKKQRFPGPAGALFTKGKRKELSNGFLPTQTPTSQSSTQGQTQASILELTDQNPAWRLMLKSEETASSIESGSMINVYNIVWAREKLSNTEFSFKMPILVAALRALDLSTGLDPRCDLVDSTGSMSCIIHRDLFERQGASLIIPGTVVVLRNVTIVKMSTGKMSATVTQNNLVSIYFLKSNKAECEQFFRLSKDEVRRNAARLNRDEKKQIRIMSEHSSNISSTIGHVQSNSSLTGHLNQNSTIGQANSFNSRFVPGLTSSPVTSNASDSGRTNDVPSRKLPLSTRLGREETSPDSSLSSIATLTNHDNPVRQIQRASPPSPFSGSRPLSTIGQLQARSLSPLQNSSKSNTSISSVTSSLSKFKAPAQSPTPTGPQLATNLVKQTAPANSHHTTITANLQSSATTFAIPSQHHPPSISNTTNPNQIQSSTSTAPKFSFKPNFVPPTKASQSHSQLSQIQAVQGDHQLQAVQGTQGGDNEASLENLFDGLDEDSLFGDF